jgi:hypothetical protein
MQIEFTYHWTHGVAAVIELPGNVGVRHNTFGTEITQPAATDNWLHLSIPAAVTSVNTGPLLMGAVFRGSTNENARVDIIRVAHNLGNVLFEESVGYVDATIDHMVRNPRYEEAVKSPEPLRALPYIKGALDLAIHVEFLSGAPIGRFLFGSGATAFGTIRSFE